MGRVPVLFMINVAKEDVYLSRILAVEVRRVKCVFPRNKVQKEMHFTTYNFNMYYWHVLIYSLLTSFDILTTKN